MASLKKKEKNRLKRRSYLKNALTFTAIFFFNIGFKDVFSFVKSEGVFVSVTIGLSFLFFVLLLKHEQKWTPLYFSSGVFFVYLLLMSFGGGEVTYGLQKAFLGIMVPLLSFHFIAKKSWNEDQLLSYLSFAVILLCCFSVAYRSVYGLFSRQVSFGLLGAITFGWVNGMAFLANALRKNKTKKHFFLMAFFFLMVLWTGSKGPLLAMGILGLINFNKILGNKLSTKIIALLLVAGGVFFINTYGDDIRSIRTIQEFVSNPEGYAKGVGKGSIGTREGYYSESLSIFQDDPWLGMGFGNWQNHTFFRHKYPHNIYLELLAETGIFGLFLFVIVLLRLKYKSIFGMIGVFGLITLAFSGDFSYFRYTFFPLLISCYLNNTGLTLKE